MEFSPYIARKSYNAHGDYVPLWRRYEMTHPGQNVPQNVRNKFDIYSPAYPTTNEDWRFAIKTLKPAEKSVLTVAGSGDQPFAFAMADAKDVDTFDISFFARIIMELKFSAIQILDYNDYDTFVHELFHAKFFHEIPWFDELAPLCPCDTISAIKQMKGCKIFHHELVHQKYIPTESEYTIAKQKIKNPMKFYWTDLQNLHTHLDTNKKYDLIYLSNIFEYFNNATQITNVLNNLQSFINKNGQIMLYISWILADIAETIEHAAQECGWGVVKSHEIKNAAMLTLTRTR